MNAGITSAVRAHRCVQRRPIRSSRGLRDAAERLAVASVRLVSAARQLAKANECIAREPECDADAPDILNFATQRWTIMAELLGSAADDVFALHTEVVDGLATGALVPEPPAERRPRIVLTPRPAPVRAFLRARLPRVAERISPLLHRRRRTPRPAAVRVPRRTSQGRAPPLPSV